MIGRPARSAAVATAALLCLVLVGCESGDDTGEQASSTTAGESRSADVDTPALRAQKAEAGIDDCPRPAAGGAAGELPDVTLPCLGGGPDVDLADLRGPAVVNLWATYCGPCKAEAPILEAAHDRLGDQVQVIGVDYQEPDPSKAIAFADELGLTFPMLSDPHAELKPGLRLQGLPMTLLVDEDGTIAYTRAGAIESEAELARLLDDHLGIDPGWVEAG